MCIALIILIGKLIHPIHQNMSFLAKKAAAVGVLKKQTVLTNSELMGAAKVDIWHKWMVQMHQEHLQLLGTNKELEICLAKKNQEIVQLTDEVTNLKQGSRNLNRLLKSQLAIIHKQQKNSVQHQQQMQLLRK